MDVQVVALPGMLGSALGGAGAAAGEGVLTPVAAEAFETVACVPCTATCSVGEVAKFTAPWSHARTYMM